MHPNNNGPRFNFRGIAADDRAFRGQARDIGHVTSVDEALEVAGLNWNVARRPYLIQGNVQVKASRFKALIRSDTGYEIAPCTDQYQPIQNRDLMGAFFAAAGEAGVKLTRAGTLYEGARVFATAEMPAQFDLPIGQGYVDAMRRNPDHGWIEHDRTVLQIVMSTGHEPGQKARFSAQAYRLVCSNGARVSEMLGVAAVAHCGKDARLKLWDVATVIAAANARFAEYAVKARVLRDTRSTPELDRAYVVQLMAPELFAAVVAETQERVHQAHPGGLSGADLLNAVIERTHMAKFEAALQTRSVAAVLDAIETQPGAGMAAGTLWGTYNGLTYQVDHRAGRNLDAAVESSLYGQGDKLKVRALDLALEYAEASRRELRQAAGARGVVNGRVVN